MMIKSSDVHPGDVIQARDRATIVEDLRTLDQRIMAQEVINGPGAWQNCRNCLSDVFFWGLGEVTADLGSDTYTLKPKYISNTNSTTTDAMTTADMNVATGIKPAITATAVGTGTVTVADEFLVFGGFDAGEDADEPIVRYFFECRGGAADETFALSATISRTDGPAVPAGDASMLHYGGTLHAERHALFKFPATKTLAEAEALKWRLQLSGDNPGELEITGYHAGGGIQIDRLWLTIAWITADFTPGTVVWPGPASTLGGYFEWYEITGLGSSATQARTSWAAGQSLYWGDCTWAGGTPTIYGAKVYWDDTLLAYSAGVTLRCNIQGGGGDPSLVAMV